MPDKTVGPGPFGIPWEAFDGLSIWAIIVIVGGAAVISWLAKKSVDQRKEIKELRQEYDNRVSEKDSKIQELNLLGRNEMRESIKAFSEGNRYQDKIQDNYTQISEKLSALNVTLQKLEGYLIQLISKSNNG